MKTNRRQFVKLASGLLVPPALVGISGILRAGTAPSLKVAGTARVGTLSRPGATEGDTAWVTGQTLGTLRNNYTGVVGVKFTVGGTAITVTEVARWVVSGNSGTHAVAIYTLSPCTVQATKDVNTSGATPGEYKWVTLDTPLNLSASTAYVIGSAETNSGDQWYDSDTTITVTAAASKDGPHFGPCDPGGTNDTYVPVNFKYHNT